MKPTVTLLTTFAALTFFSGLSAAGMTAPHAPARPASGEFARRLVPAPSGGGFRMLDNGRGTARSFGAPTADALH